MSKRKMTRREKRLARENAELRARLAAAQGRAWAAAFRDAQSRGYNLAEPYHRARLIPVPMGGQHG